MSRKRQNEGKIGARLGNAWSLALGRWRSAWRIHLAAVLLTALTGAGFLLYQSYMQELGATLSQQVADLRLLADFHVELPKGLYLPAPLQPTGSWRDRTPTAVAVARQTTGITPQGLVELSAIYPVAEDFAASPAPGTAWLTQDLAERLDVNIGQHLEISLPEYGTSITLLLTDLYQVSQPVAALLVDGEWLDERVPNYGVNRFYYDLRANQSRGEAQQALARLYSLPGAGQAVIFCRNSPQAIAEQVIQDTYGNSLSAVLLIFVFLAIGVLTSLLLSFLDSKRELSVLKSIGLTPGELWGMFTLSGLLMALAGLAGGLGLALVISSYVGALSWSVGASDIISLFALTAAVYVVAIVVPAGYAKRASVTQLLYDQPIPLFTRQVKGLNKRHPALEDKLAKGYAFFLMPVVDGKLEGFVFKRVGQHVKKGEVVGYVPRWWGMSYTEYVSPIDGVVVQWSEESGLFGIAPHS